MGGVEKTNFDGTEGWTKQTLNAPLPFYGGGIKIAFSGSLGHSISQMCISSISQMCISSTSPKVLGFHLTQSVNDVYGHWYIHLVNTPFTTVCKECSSSFNKILQEACILKVLYIVRTYAAQFSHQMWHVYSMQLVQQIQPFDTTGTKEDGL